MVTTGDLRAATSGLRGRPVHGIDVAEEPREYRAQVEGLVFVLVFVLVFALVFALVAVVVVAIVVVIVAFVVVVVVVAVAVVLANLELVAILVHAHETGWGVVF